jgi:phosphoglycerate dehydrogenase-like enzyme
MPTSSLDVLEMEPPGNNSPLLKLDNVILSAHTCRPRAGAGAGRQVADELRQSGGAAEHQAVPLAADLDGAPAGWLTRAWRQSVFELIGN